MESKRNNGEKEGFPPTPRLSSSSDSSGDTELGAEPRRIKRLSSKKKRNGHVENISQDNAPTQEIPLNAPTQEIPLQAPIQMAAFPSVGGMGMIPNQMPYMHFVPAFPNYEGTGFPPQMPNFNYRNQMMSPYDSQLGMEVARIRQDLSNLGLQMQGQQGFFGAVPMSPQAFQQQPLFFGQPVPTHPRSGQPQQTTLLNPGFQRDQADLGQPVPTHPRSGQPQQTTLLNPGFQRDQADLGQPVPTSARFGQPQQPGNSDLHPAHLNHGSSQQTQGYRVPKMRKKKSKKTKSRSKSKSTCTPAGGLQLFPSSDTSEEEGGAGAPPGQTGDSKRARHNTDGVGN